MRPGRGVSGIHFHNMNKKCFGFEALRVKLPISAVRPAEVSLDAVSPPESKTRALRDGANKANHTSSNSCLRLLTSNLLHPHPPPPSNLHKLKARSRGLIRRYHGLSCSNVNGCCLCRLTASCAQRDAPVFYLTATDTGGRVKTELNKARHFDYTA